MAAAGSTTAPGTGLSMKLLVDASPMRQRVVFAEAGKDTVDFLFSLLAMPAAAAVRLLGKEAVVGCLANLYSSAERLDDAYVVPGGAAKDAVLCATMPSPPAAAPKSYLLRLPEPPAPAPAAPKKLFNCPTTWSGCRSYVTEVRGSNCPNCSSQMVVETRVVASSEPPPAQQTSKGFVQGGTATYTVTDDLAITPMSNVSSIALLNACAVKDLGSLQERIVEIGHKEGLEILRASLQSKTVLTDVFLGKKAPPSQSTKNGYGGAPSLSNGRRREALSWRV